MSEFLLTPEADQDLNDIWDYIAHDDIDAADRWDTKLREAFAMLAANPHAGHRRRDLASSSVLFWPVGAYLIIYRILGSRVEILAVTQGSREIPLFLKSRLGDDG
ncbi:MAG: type II toxin-antitoxin system RelE/ParE family toxin [Acidobacteriota bacterium]